MEGDLGRLQVSKADGQETTWEDKAGRCSGVDGDESWTSIMNGMERCPWWWERCFGGKLGRIGALE